MARPDCTLFRHFRRLRDPRRRHLKRHLLIDIISIAICGVLAGANDWQQVATFAQEREAWLRTFLQLPNGVPSHDTLERVFALLDPAQFQACFRDWVATLAESLGWRHIAIDGKTLRRSGNKVKGWRPLHLVSAWASEVQLSLGEEAVEAKSNELTAIPRLLELLELKGALVTMDALGCQKSFTKQIVEAGGDYLLAVKENQPHLLADIRECLSQALEGDFEAVGGDSAELEERGHGRAEKRSYYVLTNPTGLRNQEDWTGLKLIGMCVSERVVQGKRSEETRYFIGSQLLRAEECGRYLRRHWSVENHLHWSLDVTFREDENRVQQRQAAENLGLLRRLALTLLKRHPSKRSLACKRLTAACNTKFLEEVLEFSVN
jgi:predicted transposase YbfD/YdcC